MSSPSPKKFDEDAFKDVCDVDNEAESDGLDVDAVIDKLLSIRSKVPGPNTMIDLDIDTINKLIERVLTIVKN